MSRREKQTNKAEVPFQPKARPTRGQRKSVIAEAMRYEAVQGAPAVDVVDTPDVTPDYSAPLEPAQTSMFSAFGKENEMGGVDDVDAGKNEAVNFETARSVNQVNSEKAPANDMTKQCSMIHRMMEMDKTDVDPRDLHKLLPSTMLTSESLDLRSEGKMTRGMAGMDVHKLLEDQAMEFQAERANGRAEQTLQTAGSMRLSPTAEEQEHYNSPPKAAAASSGGNQGMASADPCGPSSPVTGWPAAAVLGIMHPMSHHTLGHVVKPPTCVGSAADMVVQNPLMYSESASAMGFSGGAPGGVLLDWAAAYHPGGGQRIYPQPSYPSAAPPPVILEHPGQEEQYAMNCHLQASVQMSSESASPPETASPRESDSSDSSDKGDNDPSKKFKSLEAALAWCHVQHSQKQVPVVPKDDVRKLVDFQLNSGKPIRAPWYRPQGDKPEDGEQVEKPVERKPVIPPTRTRRPPKSVNKQGTGFFCPPGSSMARV